VTVVTRDNDLVQLKRRGFAFTAIFDTSIAARFLAPGARLRLAAADLPERRAAALEAARRLVAASADRRSASLRRADVLHLFALKTGSPRAAAVDASRVEEVRGLAAQPASDASRSEAFAGLKGARELSPRNLAILRELHELREQLARAADRPPFKILSPETLVAAQTPPADRAAMADGGARRSDLAMGDAILAAVGAPRRCPTTQCRCSSAGRGREFLGGRRRIDALRSGNRRAPRFGSSRVAPAEPTHPRVGGRARQSRRAGVGDGVAAARGAFARRSLPCSPPREKVSSR